MGKKAKKKARSGVKEKRNPLASANPIDQNSNQNIGTPDDGVVVVNDRKECPHVDKVIDVEKVTAKLESSEPVRCEDCREGVADRRASKMKGKHGKKKGGADPKQGSKAIWICLACGHFSCGGAGFPTTPQSHAVRHARQYHHPLAVQFENPQLRWCFPCSTLIHAKKVEDGSEQKDVFQDIVKMIKKRPTEGLAIDVEAVWFGSGSITSGIKSEASASLDADGKSGYIVRGLVNLGNTCFFNSIMQNLLAMNRLRDYFLKFDGFAGPITAALKKLFSETSNEGALKRTVNPKAFFGSICAKAPQFRGYQQQDSHELLRCLLDRLCTEELIARKQIKSSQDGGKSLSACPTFVDNIFGGRLSSTVSCLECGHTSVVHEPFLDLSLPVPTKKPPAKGAKSVFRAKKSKPPMRSVKVRPKVIRDAAPPTAQSAQGDGEKSVTEGMAVPSADVSQDFIDARVMADYMGLTSQNLCSSRKSDNAQNCEGMSRTLASADNFTWLDYLDQDTLPNGDDVVSQVDHMLTNQVSETENSVQPVDALQNNLVADTEMKLTCIDNACSPNNLMRLNDQGQSKSPDCDIASEFSKKLLVKDSGTTDAINVEHSSAFCSRICSVDSNLGTDSYTKPSEDEAPLQLQDSEVLLLPYKEVTSTADDMLKGGCKSSTAVRCEQDLLDFNGFGDLFNELDSDAQPSEQPLCSSAASQANGSSESDPEEIDNRDAPVSVESCLAYFTKPELLSKTEHAWKCENCTKVLKEKRMRFKNKLMKPRSHNIMNIREDQNPNGASSSGETFDDRLLSQKGTSPRAEQDSASWLSENGTQENQDEDNSQVKSDFKSNEVQLLEAPLVSANSESEESENEETVVKCVKVERDATKRILIDKGPPILTIHLKRFSQDARGRLSKLSGHVNFRDTIDLKPYIATRSLQKEIYKYCLIGVVEHSGTMRGGHYVAYVRGSPKITGKDKNAEDFAWYYASDAYVREVSSKEVLSCEAYILFYEET
ncbi:ubiquitin carboxyl-terminal hydrolase 2 [Nicotiana sylvestris]|uniref:Ubiquitin carboxyl-terminal hydrolase n=2 Tax=Nicotiana TaxID=4085 RepID=A0A1S3Z6D6_TOBAC|nr:PREDICTED: ubiquitin carboxyl-terminal hydrolase 2 [Nicotiana sylvestris]XP_009796001.1 PREDICTED: ubiquitin carboxyl-terminal hydrolase 2 [Nicotiana sylvestris]XP_016459958.1 PREDICTED: ubiquitin carboxyl-terminal hydrolase 2-like [Nicotiana tabacum]XP_016459959.1 PREDICTED: ubiquitin carboxyl-terminal hydrolase 2-like [Nicotiana tabacum]